MRGAICSKSEEGEFAPEALKELVHSLALRLLSLLMLLVPKPPEVKITPGPEQPKGTRTEGQVKLPFSPHSSLPTPGELEDLATVVQQLR